VDGSCFGIRRLRKRENMVRAINFYTDLFMISYPSAHRDDGGRIALAVLKCRKITISAVNGDAVSHIVC
jgi:hypothetical protein